LSTDKRNSQMTPFSTYRFGPGPHRVRMYIQLPQEKHERSFVMEMAPLSMVPHAVHLFLEQVYAGLWDNTWFYLNGPHVLQGGPQVEYEDDEDWLTEEEERKRAVKPFRDAGLASRVFPEYSEDFPHLPMTVGFAGRPGGPDIYINKINNTAAHGPGGQAQHDLDEYADACFAKIVEGTDVVKMIFDTPPITDDKEWEWFFEEPVHIVHVEIVGMPRVNNTVPGITATSNVAAMAPEGATHRDELHEAYVQHDAPAAVHSGAHADHHQYHSPKQQHHIQHPHDEHHPHIGTKHFHKPHIEHQVTP
jgi:hypothetical protein